MMGWDEELLQLIQTVYIEREQALDLRPYADERTSFYDQDWLSLEEVAEQTQKALRQNAYGTTLTLSVTTQESKPMKTKPRI